jgi:hypothetical protein
VKTLELTITRSKPTKILGNNVKDFSKCQTYPNDDDLSNIYLYWPSKAEVHFMRTIIYILITLEIEAATKEYKLIRVVIGICVLNFGLG